MAHETEADRLLDVSISLRVHRLPGTNRWHAGASFPHPDGICREIDLEFESGLDPCEAVRLLVPALTAAIRERYEEADGSA